MMQRRFDNLVPETPRDFHAGVLDGLNRMETVRRRRLQRRRKAMYAAAGVAAVFALSAALLAGLYARPERQDAVVEPQEAAAPITEGNVSFELIDCYDEGENCVLEWIVESTYDETILYEYEVRLIKGGLGDIGFSDIDQWPKNMALLGTEAAGHLLQKTVRQENWLNYFKRDAGYEELEVEKALITVNFYRPTAEFCNSDSAPFENEPRWAVFAKDSGPKAYAANRCEIVDGGRFFEETEMTILEDYYVYRNDTPAQTSEEAWAQQMRDYARLKRTALKMYGYADWIKGYEVRIDLTGASSDVQMKEVLP